MEERWRGALKDRSLRSGEREKDKEKEKGRRWSYDFLVRGGSVTLTNSSSKLNFAGVKNGEFWDTEFSIESILKSRMIDFICGSNT